jgi:hypothetical protein
MREEPSQGTANAPWMERAGAHVLQTLAQMSRITGTRGSHSQNPVSFSCSSPSSTSSDENVSRLWSSSHHFVVVFDEPGVADGGGVGDDGVGARGRLFSGKDDIEVEHCPKFAVRSTPQADRRAPTMPLPPVESPEKIRFYEILKEVDLDHEVEGLAANGIRKESDLDFVDEIVLNELTISPVSKAKLKRLIASVPRPAGTCISERALGNVDMATAVHSTTPPPVHSTTPPPVSPLVLVVFATCIAGK